MRRKEPIAKTFSEPQVTCLVQRICMSALLGGNMLRVLAADISVQPDPSPFLHSNSPELCQRPPGTPTPVLDLCLGVIFCLGPGSLSPVWLTYRIR